MNCVKWLMLENFSLPGYMYKITVWPGFETVFKDSHGCGFKFSDKPNLNAFFVKWVEVSDDKVDCPNL